MIQAHISYTFTGWLQAWPRERDSNCDHAGL